MVLRRKTRRGRSRRKQKTQRGRGRIATGSGSSIFRPPLLCSAKENTPYQSMDFIGKTYFGNYERRTNRIIQWLASIDPTQTYTLHPILWCTLAPEQTNENAKLPFDKYQQIQPYGGTTLQSRFNSAEPLATILKPLKAFFEHLRNFNKEFLHHDLHTNNLVWTGTAYKMIDFDEMTTRNTIRELISEYLETHYSMINKPLNKESEDFQKELDKQTNLYMKVFDVSALTTQLASELQARDPKLGLQFSSWLHTTPNAGLIPPFHELKDYTDALAKLFAALDAPSTS